MARKRTPRQWVRPALAVLAVLALVHWAVRRNLGVPLHRAVSRGELGKVRLLLRLGADVDVRGDAEVTPLHVAVTSDRLRVADLLIRYGADLNAYSAEGVTPLHLALRFDRSAIARLLVDRGADLNARSKWSGMPLHEAIELGRTELAKLLLERGADANARTTYGGTPLHMAVAVGRADFIPVLLARGADINAKDESGGTLLQVVMMTRSSDETAARLVRHNADLRGSEGASSTVLHRAALYGWAELARALLARGLDPTIRDRWGRTPAEVAAVNHHTELSAFLRVEERKAREAAGRQRRAIDSTGLDK